jgi:hypothetical protein
MSIGISQAPRFAALLGIKVELEYYEECLETGHPVPPRLRRRFRNIN